MQWVKIKYAKYFILLSVACPRLQFSKNRLTNAPSFRLVRCFALQGLLSGNSVGFAFARVNKRTQRKEQARKEFDKNAVDKRRKQEAGG